MLTKRHCILMASFLASLLSPVITCQFALADVPGYPDGVREAHYPSKADDTLQPTLIWTPKSEAPVPLLVALHTWSNDYRQGGGEVQYAKWCQQEGWAFVHPNFRGINKTPSALGSDLAVADILSAVDFAKTQANIDPRRIYCVGVSGGGHASMLMAARAPELWAGVSAWCGISDIAAWHAQCKDSQFQRYSTQIESVLQGAPSSSPDHRDSAWHRSPLNWIAKAERLPALDINHGINDGRAGSVPFTHSVLAWNAAVPDDKKIDPELVSQFYASRSVPQKLQPGNEARPDESYADHAPIFRTTHADVRLTIFDGGHEIVHEAALNWLALQTKGKPATWNVDNPIRFRVDPSDQQSGK